VDKEEEEVGRGKKGIWEMIRTFALEIFASRADIRRDLGEEELTVNII